MSTMAEHNPALKQYRDNLDIIIDKTTDCVHKAVVSRKSLPSAREFDLPNSSETSMGPQYPSCADQWAALLDASTPFVESYNLGLPNPQELQDGSEGPSPLFEGEMFNMFAEDLDFNLQLDNLPPW